jgi:hypothetical protein
VPQFWAQAQRPRLLTKRQQVSSVSSSAVCTRFGTVLMILVDPAAHASPLPRRCPQSVKQLSSMAVALSWPRLWFSVTLWRVVPLFAMWQMLLQRGRAQAAQLPRLLTGQSGNEMLKRFRTLMRMIHERMQERLCLVVCSAMPHCRSDCMSFDLRAVSARDADAARLSAAALAQRVAAAGPASFRPFDGPLHTDLAVAWRGGVFDDADGACPHTARGLLERSVLDALLEAQQRSSVRSPHALSPTATSPHSWRAFTPPQWGPAGHRTRAKLGCHAAAIRLVVLPTSPWLALGDHDVTAAGRHRLGLSLGSGGRLGASLLMQRASRGA